MGYMCDEVRSRVGDAHRARQKLALDDGDSQHSTPGKVGLRPCDDGTGAVAVVAARCVIRQRMGVLHEYDGRRDTSQAVFRVADMAKR